MNSDEIKAGLYGAIIGFGIHISGMLIMKLLSAPLYGESYIAAFPLYVLICSLLSTLLLYIVYKKTKKNLDNFWYVSIGFAILYGGVFGERVSVLFAIK